ncbi:hypothetical protein, partial [Thiolapillus sp.]|uniref:hypothetical protein n=1 Tax=Thiolapillus sp. TaxID=2017437 RepID=UPI003AF6E150
MTRTAGAQIGCQRPSRFWGLGCPKIYHEAEDTLREVRVFRMACSELMKPATWKSRKIPAAMLILLMNSAEIYR